MASTHDEWKKLVTDCRQFLQDDQKGGGFIEQLDRPAPPEPAKAPASPPPPAPVVVEEEKPLPNRWKDRLAQHYPDKVSAQNPASPKQKQWVLLHACQESDHLLLLNKLQQAILRSFGAVQLLQLPRQKEAWEGLVEQQIPSLLLLERSILKADPAFARNFVSQSPDQGIWKEIPTLLLPSVDAMLQDASEKKRLWARLQEVVASHV